MQKKSLTLYLLAILFSALLACGGDDDGTGPIAEPDIYILGALPNAQENRRMVYYKNEESVDVPLSIGDFAVPLDISVDGNDVYISANIQNTNSTVEYWKNGTRTRVNQPDNAVFAQAFGHIVHEGDIYLYGFVQLREGGRQPAYWRNQEYIPLESNLTNTRVTGMTFANGSLIATGYASVSGAGTVPLYWQDGEMKQLSSGKSDGSRPQQAIEHFGDFYIAALDNSRFDFSRQVMIWRNGRLTEYPLGENASVMSKIDIAGQGDIYYALSSNSQGNTRLQYYMNDQRTVLVNESDSLYQAIGIKSVGDEVHVIARKSGPQDPTVVPSYWVNGRERNYDWPTDFYLIDIFINN